LVCKGGEIYLREIINFSTKFESLEKINPLITKYRINICVPDKPAKKYIFSKQVIEGMSNTIKGSGVYAYYFERDQQIGGHEDDIVYTKTGYKRTGEPIAYGFADPYQEPYWMEKDGEKWYTTNVYMWTGRNPHIEEVLENPVWQSMEVAVNDKEDASGNKIVNEAIFLGFCLLQGINPAFEGSKIEKMSLPVTDNEIDLLKEEYESFLNMSKEGDEVIKEAVEKFSLNSDQIREILRNALSEFKYNCGDYECSKYYVDCYDAEYVYVWDNEDDKTYRLTYDIAEMVATINIESKEEVIRGNFIPVNQANQENEQMSENTTTEEISTEEDMAKKNCSENTEEMSSNEFVDNTAMQELNDKAAETNKELSNEQVNNAETETNENEKDVLIASLKEEMSTMKEKMSKMESELTSFTEENVKLKEFKASIEKQNKEFEVETTLKEVVGVLPKEDIDVFRASSENFSLENINAWKNEVKAKAFNLSKNIEKKPFIQVGLPVSDKPKRGTGLWD
jgi:hypothetical protein